MLATAVVAILLIVSCTKDPYITPGPGAGNSISLGSAAFSAEYVFSTNYDWTARSSGPADRLKSRFKNNSICSATGACCENVATADRRQ